MIAAVAKTAARSTCFQVATPASGMALRVKVGTTRPPRITIITAMSSRANLRSRDGSASIIPSAAR